MSTPRGLMPGDVLDVTTAANALGVREAHGIRWLREHGLVRVMRLHGDRRSATVERVIWGDVLEKLRAAEPLEPPPAPAPRRGLRRATSL